MNKTAFTTLIILIALTLISALVSNLDILYKISVLLALALLKFTGVAFQFMELKKAHIFWKISTGVFLVLFILMIYIVY